MNKVLMIVLYLFLLAKPVFANQNILGVHILSTDEINKISDLLPNGGYVTIPMSINDMDSDKWQNYLDVSAEYNYIPIIRLVTAYENHAWRRPTKYDIVSFCKFMNKLNWQRDNLIIVLFNEPNHAGEWGGKVDPLSYGEILSFALNWFKTEKKNYVILPAALDMAADGNNMTMPADKFLSSLIENFPMTVKRLDAWNSHAYPNPGFTALPLANNFASLKSYQWEIDLLNDKLGKEFAVYITETGWDSSKIGAYLVAQYFNTAYDKIWNNDERVSAVTPFLFDAQTLPFSNFSLLDKNNRPTQLYEMIRTLNKESK